MNPYCLSCRALFIFIFTLFHFAACLRPLDDGAGQSAVRSELPEQAHGQSAEHSQVHRLQ